MLKKFHHWWQESRSSFWFVPAVIVLDAVALAIVLITVDATVDLPVVKRWPLLLYASAAGARSLLTTVAGSMITVAGVVFSITLVVLSLASSRYTSRVNRTFMRDHVTQVVLGVFVGIFAYCLVVLRTIRGEDEGTFVSALAMLTGLILAFVGIAYLIYFIHHISVSIQASSIIAATAEETIAAVDRLFAQELGNDDGDGILWTSLADQRWSAIGRPVTSRVLTQAHFWMWPASNGQSCGWNAVSGSLSSRAHRCFRWRTRAAWTMKQRPS